PADANKDAAKDAPKDATKTAAGAGKNLAGPESRPQAGAGGRRGVGTVYKVNEKFELVPIPVRTGIASNQHTELISGDIKPGDELVVRDLQDKTKK
ncbi:MAG: hypothetical protein ACK50D_07750, partial [Burkholderiales bacterium]